MFQLLSPVRNPAKLLLRLNILLMDELTFT